jgi:mannose-6-phosphate isomerase-like protein (cupin superfamily)
MSWPREPLDRIAIPGHRSWMRITLLITFAVLVAFGTSTETQRRGAGRPATLAIVLTDPSGTPISNALVTVEGAAERSARTERGRIVFEGVPAGSYRLRFEREGFVTLERELVARAGAPTEIKATLNPAAPVKPLPCVETSRPAPVAGSPIASPMAIDLLDFIEKNYVGKQAGKTSAISCAPGGGASMIQVREPLEVPAHADADEFLYVIAGTGAVRIGQRVEMLQSGVLMLVPRTMPHVLTSRGRNPLVVLSIRAGERCGTTQATR